MRRILIYLFLVSILFPSCSVVSGRTTHVVKPKYHHSWFNRSHRSWYKMKKDSKAKRTRVVKMKS